MRCQICEKFTFHSFCNNCKELLKPSPVKTTIGNLDIISFYQYEEIEKILKYKYEKFGDTVLHDIAKVSLKEFFRTFDYEEKVTVIPIDDKPNNFSHTGILAKYCKKKNVDILYSSLHAQTQVQYAGKDLIFRKNNPKNFKLLKKVSSDVILLDDIVTTGTTLLEGKELLEKNGIKVLFGLTLATANK